MIMDTDQLAGLFHEVISGKGCELIEIKIKGSRAKPLLQIFADREGGITVDDCAQITRQLTEILDQHFPEIPQYRLEVSSPGTNRPLKTESDFHRNLGREVKISYIVSGSEVALTGKIEKTGPESVTIRSGEELKEINYSDIRSAGVKLRW